MPRDETEAFEASVRVGDCGFGRACGIGGIPRDAGCGVVVIGWCRGRDRDRVGWSSCGSAGEQLTQLLALHGHQPTVLDHGWPRRGPVVHQRGQQLDRADHHHRVGHELHRPRHQQPAGHHRRAATGPCGSPTRPTTRSGGSPPPGRSPTTPAPASATRRASPPGRDGALWFTNAANNSIGRITTAGSVTNYTGPGISNPHAITAGSDGALWFTNLTGGSGCSTHAAPCGSIGRITTSGTVTDYTDPGFSHPQRITAGPDGALWFTQGDDAIGRITTTGKITVYTVPGISNPQGITAGPDGALWFTNREATRSGGSPPAGPSPTTPAPASATRRGSPPGPTGPCGSPTWATARSGGSPPAGPSPTTPAPASADPLGITAGPDGALWFTNYIGGSIGRITTAGTVTSYTSRAPARAMQAITAGPDGALWFTNYGTNSIGRITTSRHRDQLHRRRHQRPVRDHRRSRRRALVHQPHRRVWMQHLQAPCGSIGRITTTGIITNYTGT